MNQNPHHSLPPLHDSLPPLKLSEAKNEMMGFRLGSAFRTQKQAFDDLVSHGYEAPPEWRDKPFQRFMLEKLIDKSAAFEMSFTFEYHEEKLTRIGFVLAKNSQANEDQVEILREYEGALVEALGKPHLILDRVATWSKQNIHTQDPSIAYALFWSSSKNVPPQENRTAESVTFFNALLALGHDGALATITGVLGNVMASVDLFQGSKAAPATGQFLPFMKS